MRLRWRDSQIKAIKHKSKEGVPALKEEIAGQGFQSVEEGKANSQGRAEQAVGVIDQMQSRVGWLTDKSFFTAKAAKIAKVFSCIFFARFAFLAVR